MNAERPANLTKESLTHMYLPTRAGSWITNVTIFGLVFKPKKGFEGGENII